jgi:hypothetical protein
MDAQVGDRLVVQGNQVGTPHRGGTVVEVLGTPAARRYRVRWDDGHETVFFPSSDTRGEHVEPDEHADTRPVGKLVVTQVELGFEEDDVRTQAWATLRTPTQTFTGRGEARRNPVDDNVPLVGEELAAARALIDLADNLRSAAGEVIQHRGHPEGHLAGQAR